MREHSEIFPNKEKYTKGQECLEDEMENVDYWIASSKCVDMVK